MWGGGGDLIIMTAVGVAAALLFLGLVFTRRHLSQHRCVLLHAPAPSVWRRIEDFPLLLAEHGRGRVMGAYGQHAFVKGDPGRNGSVWRSRGSWAGEDYWVDVELVRVEAGKEIVIRLVRDALNTHRALRGHIARLTLKPNGSGTSKLTWDLQARFRPLRLLWQRHFDRVGLNARLLDICLRSVKVDIDNSDIGAGDQAGNSAPRIDRNDDEASRAVVDSSPVTDSDRPPLHLC